MPDDDNKSFWSTLPGVLTGIAAVITAIGGIATLVVTTRGGDKQPETTLAEWAEQANEICDEAYEDIRALGLPPDPYSQFRAIPDVQRISTRANQQLQALDRPPDADERIAQLLEVSSRAHVAAQNAYNSWSAGDTPRAQAFLNAASRDNAEVQRVGGQLGANVCAQGP